MLNFKSAFIGFVCCIATVLGYSQSQSTFNYQGVVRDDNGVILKDAEIALEITLVSDIGDALYREEHRSVFTNPFGVFSISIGSGEVPFGLPFDELGDIDWSKEITFQVALDIDVTDGFSYIPMGEDELRSTPYSLYAVSGGSDPSTVNELQDLSGANLTGTTLNIDIENGNGVSVDLSSLQDGTGTDDQQLTFNDASKKLIIEGGNEVDLSTLSGSDGTDDQNLTGATLTGTVLEIGIEDGTSTNVDLSSLQDGTGTDDQQLTFNDASKKLMIEGGNEVDLSSLTGSGGTDDQNLTGATLTGTVLEIGIEDGTSTNVDLVSLQDGTGTDDQGLTGATLTGTNLEIEIENGSSANVDLSSLQDGTGTDDQQLTFNDASKKLMIEGGNEVDLSSLTGSGGTDDQNLTGATLTGTVLEIGIEDGMSTNVDLVSLQDGTGTDDQGLTGATLTGTNLEIEIENGSSANVDLGSLQDGVGTDDQQLTFNDASKMLTIEGGNVVDLSSLTGSGGTDDQQLTGATYTDGTLSISLEDGGSVDADLSELRSVMEDADGDTGIELLENLNDQIEFRIDNNVLTLEHSGQKNIRLKVPTNESILIGNNRTGNLSTAANNIFIGAHSGAAVTSSFANTSVGYKSLENSNGDRNTALGSHAGTYLITGRDNAFLGAYNGTAEGNENVCIGNATGARSTGSQNVMLGRSAGLESLGEGSVYIGYRAGVKDSLSNRLMIDNSDTQEPLIDGDFSANRAVINGSLRSTESLIIGNDFYPSRLNTVDTFFYVYQPQQAIRMGRSAGGVLPSYSNDSLGKWSLTMGYNSWAKGNNSIACGSQAWAEKDGSMALGVKSSAKGDQSVALAGGIARDSRTIAHIGSAEGYGSVSLGASETVGEYAIAGGLSSSEGNYTTAFGKSEVTKEFGTATGNSFADGRFSSALGASVASGDWSVGIGSGLASGDYSIAFGRGQASSDYSFAVIRGNANADYAVAMGELTIANGIHSQAFGRNNQSSGFYCHTTGTGNINNGYAGTVVGVYNDPILSTRQTTPSNSTPLFIVGAGDGPSSTFRKNAFQVLKSGQATFNTNDIRLRGSAADAITSLKVHGGLGKRARVDFYEDQTFKATMGYRGTTGETYIWEQSSGDVLVAKNNMVGLNRTPITNNLEVQGTASKSTAGSWLGNSDARLKKGIKYLSSQEILEKVLEMKGAEFEWDDSVTGTTRPEGKQYGFIAQDLVKVWPEKIKKDNLGYLQTAYGDYDPMFVEAIKALNEQIESLTKENNRLKEELSHQDDRLVKIEEKMAEWVNTAEK